MDKRKSPILIEYAKCSPCFGLICVGVCPQGILEVGVDSKPRIIDAISCTQCGVCVNLCPVKAIIIARGEQSRDR